MRAGGCLCGAVRYEATEPPQEVGYCHCRMCQKWTGNVFMAYAKFRSAAFWFTQGEPNFYQSSAWLDPQFAHLDIAFDDWMLGEGATPEVIDLCCNHKWDFNNRLMECRSYMPTNSTFK